MTITLKQARAQWLEQAADLPQDDIPMLAEDWNNYTDMLRKDGELADLQYQYAPAHDEPVPDSDLEYLLECMGVDFDYRPMNTRPDRLMDDMPHHWHVTLTRKGAMMRFYFSGGSAVTDIDAETVLENLFTDYRCGYHTDTLEAFCSDLGYEDINKAARVWKATKKQAADLETIFSENEIEQLAEIINA